MTEIRPTWSERVLERVDPTGLAVIDGDHRVSYAELFGMAYSAAEWLNEIGAPGGEPVPALFNTSTGALAMVVAGASTLRPLAPLGPRLTVREISGCVTGMDGKVLVVEPGLEQLGEQVAAASGARCFVLPELGVAAGTLAPIRDADATVAYLHTSGTTGAPKRVPLRQDRLSNRVAVSSALMGIEPGSAYASGSPFYHIAGLGNLAVVLAKGATNLPFPTFSVEAWRQLGEAGVTHAFLVPTMIERLLEEDALHLPSLQLLQYGSSPIRASTLARAVKVLPGVRFINMFGQTEGSPIACLTPEDHVRAVNGRSDLLTSVGRAAPGIELKLIDQEPSGVGEVLCRGEHLFREGDDGWLHTGDLGVIDDEGYVYLVGRLGDRIKRGGENVHPVEVEHVLAEHPNVREAAVVGVADDILGQAVKAFIIPAMPGNAPPQEELRAFARERLSGYKVPSQWEFVDDLPRNASGKVLRRLLVPQSLPPRLSHQPPVKPV